MQGAGHLFLAKREDRKKGRSRARSRYSRNQFEGIGAHPMDVFKNDNGRPHGAEPFGGECDRVKESFAFAVIDQAGVLGRIWLRHTQFGKSNRECAE